MRHIPRPGYTFPLQITMTKTKIYGQACHDSPINGASTVVNPEPALHGVSPDKQLAMLVDSCNGLAKITTLISLFENLSLALIGWEIFLNGFHLINLKKLCLSQKVLLA